MRKITLMLIMAVAVVISSCSKEQLDGSTTEGGKNVATANFSINMNNAATYALKSDVGGWTNMKADQTFQADYDYRAIIQIFAANATPGAAAIREVRMVSKEAPSADNQINFDNIALPVGNYTAVVWVDFVAQDAVATADLFYNTKDLRNVTVLSKEGDKLELVKPGTTTPITTEARDAYSSATTFTVNPDGTITGEVDNYLTLTAKRAIAKVRFVLTDYKGKADWRRYFEGNDTNRVFDHLSLSIAGMCKNFNALTGTPITTTNLPSNYFTICTPWSNANTDATIDNVEWYTMDGIEYPVVACNYLIPFTNDDAACYDMKLNLYAMNGQTTEPPYAATSATLGSEGIQVLSSKSFTGVPVRKNTLTTIIGKFLTVNKNFTILVEDEFDQKANQVVLPDGQVETIIENFDGMTIQYTQDAHGQILNVRIPATGFIPTVDQPQLDAFIAKFNKLDDQAPLAGGELSRPNRLATATVELHIGSTEINPELSVANLKPILKAKLYPHTNLTLVGINNVTNGTDVYDDTNAIPVNLTLGSTKDITFVAGTYSYVQIDNCDALTTQAGTTFWSITATSATNDINDATIVATTANLTTTGASTINGLTCDTFFGNFGTTSTIADLSCTKFASYFGGVATLDGLTCSTSFAGKFNAASTISNSSLAAAIMNGAKPTLSNVTYTSLTAETAGFSATGSTATGATTINSNGAVELINGTTTGATTITSTGAVTLNGGAYTTVVANVAGNNMTIANPTMSGQFTINGAATIQGKGTATISAGSFNRILSNMDVTVTGVAKISAKLGETGYHTNGYGEIMMTNGSTLTLGHVNADNSYFGFLNSDKSGKLVYSTVAHKDTYQQGNMQAENETFNTISVK